MKIEAKIIKEFGYYAAYRYEFGNNVIHRTNSKNVAAVGVRRRIWKVLIENQV